MKLFLDTAKVEDIKEASILTELITIDPTLKADDIIIEGVTPENLQKQYDDFTTVLDKLAGINKDVYRLKQWDIDTWSYQLKTIAYISHFWDVALSAYKDGIGRQDDLEVSIAKPNETTNAVVRFYVKSQERMTYYLLKQELLKTFRFELSAHQDVLNPFESNYRIRASERLDITDEDISFKISDIKTDSASFDIQHFVTEDHETLSADGIEVIDERLIQSDRRYVMRLVPDGTLKDYFIKTLEIVGKDKTTSLITPTASWQDQFGELRFTGYKFFGNKINHFSSVTGAIDLNDRVTLAPNSNIMVLNAQLPQMPNQAYYCYVGSNLVPILSDYVSAYDFDYNETEYTWTSHMPSNNCRFTISGKMNGLRLEIEGKAWVRIITEQTIEREFAIVDNFVSIPISKNPRDCYVEIISTSSTEPLIIKQVKYCSFETIETLANGSFVEIDGGLYLPNHDNNTDRKSVV